MSIKVISPLLFKYNNTQVAEVKGETIGECLDDLTRQFPDLKRLLFDEQGNLHDYLFIYLNQQSVSSDELDNPVKDGDEIHIIVLIEGG
jgi:adenylyltransferase/sulfurtransferase